MKCDFCDERKGIQTIYNTIYGNYDRLAYETKNFVVFPCMGQLREGHLLIASKKHYNAVGLLEDYLVDELDSLLKKVCSFIYKEYGKEALVFEHGVFDNSGKSGGCGIYHLHLHVIPIDDDEQQKVFKKVSEQKSNTIVLAKGLKDTELFVKNNETYVFLGKANESGLLSAYIVTSNDNYFESQYMRKIVANVFGTKNWNWKDNKELEEELKKTTEKAKRYFELL